MTLVYRCAPFFVLFVALMAIDAPADQPLTPGAQDGQQGSRDAVDAQPQLVRIAATVDGSGKIIFTRGKVSYEHKHWDRPSNVSFDGTPWPSLDMTPAPWTDYGAQLDLTKAWVVKRQGRDIVALEHTPDGFDLYLCDSPDGSTNYEVTIAIPRRR